MFVLGRGVVVAVALLLPIVLVPVSAQSSSATLEATVPAGTKNFDELFQVDLTVSELDGAWAGYNIILDYDEAILRVDDVQPGDAGNCSEPSSWAAPIRSPYIHVGCAFQDSTEVGAISVVTFACIANGSSDLHFVTLKENATEGTSLFDVQAVNLDTELKDAAVECVGGGAPQRTPSQPAGSGTPSAAGDATTVASNATAAALGTPVAGQSAVAGPGSFNADSQTQGRDEDGSLDGASNSSNRSDVDGPVDEDSDGSSVVWWLIAGVAGVVVLGALGAIGLRLSGR